MTPTIYRVIVKNIYIFNNTNNISFFLFTSHLYINAVFWEIWSTFVLFTAKFLNYTFSLHVKYYIFMKKSLKLWSKFNLSCFWILI